MEAGADEGAAGAAGAAEAATDLSSSTRSVSPLLNGMSFMVRRSLEMSVERRKEYFEILIRNVH